MECLLASAGSSCAWVDKIDCTDVAVDLRLVVVKIEIKYGWGLYAWVFRNTRNQNDRYG